MSGPEKDRKAGGPDHCLYAGSETPDQGYPASHSCATTCAAVASMLSLLPIHGHSRCLFQDQFALGFVFGVMCTNWDVYQCDL